MKRAIALHAGVLGLSAFFASAASANTCFSTGPLENDVSNHSDKFRVVVLNNQNEQGGSLTATVLVQRLNGTKSTAFFDTFPVGAEQSHFTQGDTSELPQLAWEGMTRCLAFSDFPIPMDLSIPPPL